MREDGLQVHVLALIMICTDTTSEDVSCRDAFEVLCSVSVSGCIYVGDAERAWVRLCVT